MMIKLNVTLPSGAQVAIETDDKDFVREVLYSTMPHLNGTAPPTAGVISDAGATALASTPSAYPDAAHANGHEQAGAPASQSQPQPSNGHRMPSDDGLSEPVAAPQQHVATTAIAPPPTRQPAAPEPATDTAPAPTPTQAPAAVVAPATAPPPMATPSSPDDHEFIAFCQRVNPLGDMRRVVVAAEAADRHLAVKSVDPDELSRLFTLAGWPIPHSFVQTLRNAARSKFRWMERIPGQLGHYRVTNAGRKIVLGENATAGGGASSSDA